MGRAAAERRGRHAAASERVCIATEGPCACREAGEAGGGWERHMQQRNPQKRKKNCSALWNEAAAAPWRVWRDVWEWLELQRRPLGRCGRWRCCKAENERKNAGCAPCQPLKAFSAACARLIRLPRAHGHPMRLSRAAQGGGRAAGRGGADFFFALVLLLSPPSPPLSHACAAS